MYYITHWHERYEVNAKGYEPRPGDQLRAGPLTYIRLKVYGHKQGTGFRRLKAKAAAHTMEVFGIFCKFLELAGNHHKELRGKLLNENDEPANMSDLAFILDCPEDQIDRAIKVLLDVGWLKEEESNKEEEKNSTQLNSSISESPEFPGNSRNSQDSLVSTDAVVLARTLFDIIRQRKPDFKMPNLKQWALDIDKMIRLDKRDPQAIFTVMRWCQEDEFWQNNILSCSKLRKQFDQLELKMNREATGRRRNAVDILKQMDKE